MQTEVRFRGLDELGTAFRRFADDAKTAVEAIDVAAARTVADVARGKARSLGSVAAKSAPAVGYEDTALGADLVVDGNAYPFALGAEAGSTRYPQFDPYRGAEDGYFAHPAAAESEDRVEALYVDAIENAIRRNSL